MTIQTMTAPRAAILKIFDLDSSAWNQRLFRNEVALGFGLSRPAFANTFGEIDFFAIMLTTMIARYLGIRAAAALVRKYWLEWLKGLARAEHETRVGGRPRGTNHLEEVCFVIGVDAAGEVEVEIGECETIYNKFVGAGLLAFPIPLDLVLRRLRDAARKAKVAGLPKQFTPGLPDSAGFKSWITTIEDIQRFTNMKPGVRKPKKAKVKAKATA